MTKREAKIQALTYLSEWAWDCSKPTSCKDMTLNEQEATQLARAFEEIGLSLYRRWRKLEKGMA